MYLEVYAPVAQNRLWYCSFFFKVYKIYPVSSEPPLIIEKKTLLILFFYVFYHRTLFRLLEDHQEK